MLLKLNLELRGLVIRLEFLNNNHLLSFLKNKGDEFTKAQENLGMINKNQ